MRWNPMLGFRLTPGLTDLANRVPPRDAAWVSDRKYTCVHVAVNPLNPVFFPQEDRTNKSCLTHYFSTLGGVNCRRMQVVQEAVRDGIANLLSELKKHGQPTLFVRSQFWQDVEKDQLMKQACADAGGIFVDISHLGLDAANYARAERKIEHVGVAGHPGDKGMQEPADALWNAIRKQASLNN